MTTQAPGTEQIRQAWESVAAEFDDSVSPLTMRFGETVVDRLDVGPGTTLLDIGAGSGALAIPAARRGADVLAVDLAPTMIDRLNERARELPNLRGQVMDGEHLDLAENTFDVSGSINGVTLFPHVDVGIAEMARVTKPGGKVALIGFAHGVARAEFVAFLFAAVRTAVPDAVLPPTDPPPLPFQLADPRTLRTKLIDAGLADVSVEVTTWDIEVRSAAHYWDAVTASNPIAARVVAQLSPEQQMDVRRVIDGMLRERSNGAPGAVLHNAMNLGVGTAG
ncbi:class I SAM-dependent methyltransferase [Haloechinothrix salitolerans]|uniref:Class I SAM-dependent methyltransferase n=1 Tax=Haloechinothrix salitolerans TaxID=926830 RepID=A0ABW2C3Q4_9PSEU